ncbi:hypothetical protein RRG08_065684 [Elysia crispata]|uniref:Uncharacterized protein n=1 Tax=Elysia crispata TaxID=231223 RepID=A0AAE0Y497_9GAST|nr:hypothetical protein RRG08_065684 [Elysia crispata]
MNQLLEISGQALTTYFLHPSIMYLSDKTARDKIHGQTLTTEFLHPSIMSPPRQLSISPNLITDVSVEEKLNQRGNERQIWRPEYLTQPDDRCSC